MNTNAFLQAAHCNFERMRAMLADDPALLHAVGPDGETALGAAGHAGATEAAKYLLECGLPLDIFTATMLGWKEEVTTLLQANPLLAKASAAHAHGHPILAFAAVTDQVEMANLLLGYGADPNAVDDMGKGYTALHAAAQHGRPAMARWLLEHGADPTAATRPFAVTPLHLAALFGHVEVVASLLSCGADISARTRDGESPLDNARFNGHAAVAAQLEKHMKQAP